MSIVSAFLIPGSPLPYLKRDNPPWGEIANAMEVAGKKLATSNPDTIVVYSTQWIAVLDQLWQARQHIKGNHVDPNWHEYGALQYDINIDIEYTAAVIEGTIDNGLKAKGVDYDEFPIDTGTIIATNFLNPKKEYPLVICSNNIYHDWNTTINLGNIVSKKAKDLNRKIAIIGVGGLSGSFYRHTIDIKEDKISSKEDDEWNKKILELIKNGDRSALLEACPQYATEAKVDMGFKHFAFIQGALGSLYQGAIIHHYGSLYGTGAAVIEFNIG